jgi:2-haloacid dehalogenase
MSLDRRTLLAGAGGAMAGLLLPPWTDPAPPRRPLRAVAFDAFPILDPRPVFGLAETLFPGKGSALSDAWRTRQFEYQWLRALMGRYADFWQTTEEALVYAAELLKLELTPARRAQLMQAYLELKAWPDVAPALEKLKERGLRLAFLSNMTDRLLEAGIRNAALQNVFDEVLSTDRIRSYKPDPRAYQLGVDALKLPREEILFASFAGWDAAGAMSFGYPVFWVNRLGLPQEELGLSPDGSGRDLTDLVSFIEARG